MVGCAAAAEDPLALPGHSAAARLEASHETLSRMLEAFLRRADVLFSGDQTYDAPTGSYVQLGSGWMFRREEDGGGEAPVITRAKINLPRTHERIQLLIDRDIDNVFRSASDRAAANAGTATGPNDSTFVGLRAIAVETLKLKLTADAGVRPRGLSPDPYVRGRAERLFTAGEWHLPLSETLLWRRSEDWSATTQLGLLRTLRSDVLLSLYTTATWRDAIAAFDLSEVATLVHRLDDRALLALELGIYGQTEPSLRTTAFSVSLRYRRRVHSDWLLVEVRPQIVYPEARAFRPVPTLTVTLEMFFGSGRFPGP